MRRALAAALTLSIAAAPASALNLITGGVGTSGADFLTVGVGARPLAMGGAFAAVDDGVDANAVNWNPGALGLLDKPSVTASYNSLFQDENQGYLGYAAPVGTDGGVWGAGVDYLMISKIEKRAGDTETPDSTFTNSNYAAGATYAKSFDKTVSAGATLKFVHAQLDTLSESAMAVDAGALWRTRVEGLSFGASMRNLGTNIGPDSMPLTLRGGAAYKTLERKNLTIASDFSWLATERRAYWGLGAEYWVGPNLAARAGYEFGHGSDQLQSRVVGLGVGIGLKVRGFTMDYAFLPYGDLGNTHRVTLGMRFE